MKFLEWGCVGQGCVAVARSAPCRGASRAVAKRRSLQQSRGAAGTKCRIPAAGTVQEQRGRDAGGGAGGNAGAV